MFTMHVVCCLFSLTCVTAQFLAMFSVLSFHSCCCRGCPCCAGSNVGHVSTSTTPPSLPAPIIMASQCSTPAKLLLLQQQDSRKL